MNGRHKKLAGWIVAGASVATALGSGGWVVYGHVNGKITANRVDVKANSEAIAEWRGSGTENRKLLYRMDDRLLGIEKLVARIAEKVGVHD